MNRISQAVVTFSLFAAAATSGLAAVPSGSWHNPENGLVAAVPSGSWHNPENGLTDNGSDV